MSNPNGPYPGRQLFLGLSADRQPAFAYLVTGRNPQSRERRAVRVGDSTRIGPIGQTEYDPLRHYTAVRVDDLSGIVAVSNGIQTEAIFETYRLLFNTDSAPARGYMKKILDGAGAEPDSYHTPRIAGVITYRHSAAETVLIVGIKMEGTPASTFRVKAEPGVLVGVSTYRGDMDSPQPFDPDSELPRLSFTGKTAQDLAEHLFELSEATYQEQDIRVCSIGGVCPRDGTWSLHIQNQQQEA